MKRSGKSPKCGSTEVVADAKAIDRGESPEPTAAAPSVYIGCGKFGAFGLRPGAFSGGSGSAFRYMHAATARIVRFLFLLLICARGLCQTPEQASQHRSLVDSLQTLVGTFESAARGDSLFADKTSTNGVALFTLTLETNSTYFVFCACAFIVPKIDGGGDLVPGNEFGTWRRGGDRYHPELVLTATNRSHMHLLFPSHMKVDRRDLNRLTAINPAQNNLEFPLHWVPLSSPYFYRKSP
jgi:hypothetical protein